MSVAHAALLLGWGLVSQPVRPSHPVDVFIPTSRAINIARMIARNEGYTLGDERRYWFDVRTQQDGTPLLAGFVSIEFVWNGHHVNTFAINEKTLQTIDSGQCILFDYPELRSQQKQITRLNGAKLLTMAELQAAAACDSSLQIHSRRRR